MTFFLQTQSKPAQRVLNAWGIRAVLWMVLAVPLACQSTGEVGQKAERSHRQDAKSAKAGGALNDIRENAQQLGRRMASESSGALRAQYALTLARLEHFSAVPILKRASSDPDPRVRANAAFGLGQLDLVLTSESRKHRQIRQDIVKLIVKRISVEKEIETKRAFVRALGRIGNKNGLQALAHLATEGGEVRADALTALGVLAVRRSDRSSQQDQNVIAAILRGVADADVTVRRGAAYALFRQNPPISEQTYDLLQKETDAQALIHILRYFQRHPTQAHRSTALLNHSDWRVQIEAVKSFAAGAKIDVKPFIAFLNERAIALTKGDETSGPLAHVVVAGCRAMGNMPVGTTDKVLGDIVEALREPWPFVACACAAARDARWFRMESVGKCSDRIGAVQRRLFEIDAIRLSSVSSEEKIERLKRYLEDPETRVRVTAAQFLVGLNRPEAASLASEYLISESDPGVISTLLQAFTQDNRQFLSDQRLAEVVSRLIGGQTFEDIEPLLQAIKLLKSSTNPVAREALALLNRHQNPRVRHFTLDVPHGERTSLTWATALVNDPIYMKDLPLAAKLKTESGEATIAFFREDAPIAVWNFASLARQRFFNETIVHRVVPDFVTQAGDPTADGHGGPGYTIPCENNDRPFVRGTLGMALDGKDTGGSQFFITHSDQPHLDGRYTAFGEVTSGQEVIESILQGQQIIEISLHAALPRR